MERKINELILKKVKIDDFINLDELKALELKDDE